MQPHSKKPSLQWQLVGIVLLCWILPVAITMVAMSNFTRSSLNEQTVASYLDTVQINAKISADRLDDAVQASRAVAYQSTIKNDYRDYRRGGRYSELYASANEFLRRQYRSDDRFRFALIWFVDDPVNMTCSSYNESLGATSGDLDTYWMQDHEAVAQATVELDTGVAFLNRNGRIYMVRNIMSSSLKPIGTLVLQLNPEYFFGNFQVLPWHQSTALYLDSIELLIGDPPPVAAAGLLEVAGETAAYSATLQQRFIYGERAGDGYTFSYLVGVGDEGANQQLAAFYTILGAMALILLPLMLFAVRFFYRNVSRPMEQLVAGARQVELGNFGVQLRHSADNREFAYLENSFNEMSLQLEELFHRIYDEELALRDARLKALQSQINPHFLNNTLELINWEARMSGNDKVTQMIESLSTMLDAAMARDGRHTVRLSEEMMYVDAYLYIISERLGKRLTIVKEIDSTLLDCMVPRLVMQPIIENAVEHGITPRQQGCITLRAGTGEGWLLLQVCNDGEMAPEDLERVKKLLGDEEEQPLGSTHIGIRNVHQRLRMTYGKGSGLTIEEREGGVVATIRIPLER